MGVKVDTSGKSSTEVVQEQIKESMYPPNSHTKKMEYASIEKSEPEKSIKKVVSGAVMAKKKSLFKRFAETFVGEDVNNVKSYVIYDVLIPAVKATFADMVNQGLEMLFFPNEQRRGTRTSRDRGRSYVSYDRAYRPEPRQSTYVPSRAGHNFDEIILTSKGEAEVVLSHLIDLIDDYGIASVSDFYSLVGVQGNYMDNKWGWKNLNAAEIQKVRDGWLIYLPKAIPLD